jgi:hypothetical protein
MASVRKVPRVRSSVNVAPHRAHFETLPNGNSSTCDWYESRLTELLDLSPRTNSEVLVPAECVD